MNLRSVVPVSLCLVTLTLNACAGLIPTPEPQDPDEYVNNALDWIETHAVFGEGVNWTEVRSETLALAPGPKNIADTYPAIRLTLRRLNDGHASLDLPVSDRPNTNMGLWAIAPQNIVIVVHPGGPAAKAGIRVGDVIELVNGTQPRPFLDNPAFSDLDYGIYPQVHLKLHRPGQVQSIRVLVDQTAESPSYPFEIPGRKLGVGSTGIGYMELPGYSGYPYTYPGLAHELIRSMDRTPVCGWIIDVRRLGGGNLWSYLAAIGPILGEGDVGGFLYRDGTHELWSYRNGKVFWAAEERDESLVQSGIYQPKRSMLPVALLTSPATIAAGELVIVAFEGRPKVRTFGEPTRGFPTLSMHTPLSDGAHIYVSGAFGTDRNGKVYKGPILPDEHVEIDWSQFGSDQDPVLLAAQTWLNTQPECKN